MVNRTKEVTIEGETYKLARYNVEVDEPRPGNNRHFCLMPRLFVRNHSFSAGRDLRLMYIAEAYIISHFTLW